MSQDPCNPDFGNDNEFIYNSDNFLEDFIAGYYLQNCYSSSIRHFLVWMRGHLTIHTAQGVPLHHMENSGEITLKNSSGTITMTLSTSGDIFHPGDMTTEGDSLLKGKLNVRDVTTFEIPNPTSPGSFLNHGALQSREHALYVRGVGTGTTINLPATWVNLIASSSVTAHITPAGLIPAPVPTVDTYLSVPTVLSTSNTQVTLYNPYNLPFHYLIIGKRKDIPDA